MSVSHLTAILRRIVFAAVFIAVAMTSYMPPARGTEDSAPEEWIFKVLMLPQWTIADAIFAYQFKGAYYLPVIELGEAYEFLVEAETDRAFVTGFAGREENTYTLDGERGEMIIKGVSEPLPVDAILSHEFVDDSDIYVQLEVLNKIWPVEMQLELAAITIFAEPEEELSFVRRAEREEKRDIIEAQKALRETLDVDSYPYKENPYQWFGKPAFDLQSSYTYDNREKRLTGSNNISGTQQIGKFIADYNANYSYINGKLRRPDNIRARFFRQAPEGEDLLIPTLKSVEFGDVSFGLRDLIGNNQGGRGVVISNAPTTRSQEFDRITVEGTGPPGWELELYNNNELLRFGAIEDDGEYRFEDVILNFGNNRIRVIMYGPQGQVREIVEEYDIRGKLLSPGELRYRAGYVDGARSLIVLENEDAPDTANITRSAEVTYGVNKWLSLFGSYTLTPFQDRETQFYTGGFAFNSPLGIGEIEAYRRINGGDAFDARFITELLGLRLNLRSTFFSKFESQIAGSGDGAKRFEAEAQVNTRLPIPFLPMSLRLNTRHLEFVDGTVTTEFDTSQTFTGGGLRFGHGTSSRFVNEEHESSSGDFNTTWNKGAWQTRGAFNYAIHPEPELTSSNLSIRYNPRNTGFQTGLTASHNFSTSISGVNGQIGYDFDDILATFDADYRRERGWRFILRATTSIDPFTPDREYKLASSSKRNQASVLGRVFIDRDGDGTFTEGDEPVEGAQLRIGTSKGIEKTDESGFVVTGARPNEKTVIRVDEASLEDPYFTPAVDGYSVMALRGSMPGFEFPIIETGAIDGTVWRESNGKPVSGMNLELVNEDGEIAMTTQTAFDGYYAFEFVLPGTYIVRADPSYQVDVPTETVTVSSDELYAFGVDLYLLEPAAEESAADQVDGASGGIAQLPTTAPAVSGTTQPAPASPLDDGSSVIDEEPSDEDSAPVVESSVGEGSSQADSSDSNGGASSVGISIVKDVRIGERPDEVRLVLDLSGPASYDIIEGDGLIVLVDLPASVWGTVTPHEFKYSKILQSYFTETLPGKGTRLILKAENGMIVKDHKLQSAENGKPDRLIIDLKAK